ncbi:hypothetical protein [Nocardiopsis sp. NPDC058789]|uniref:hypothetical protein n=1 Tax=Nocardiopsis sp. NPDC058789 TaxID=3346634 RepID=UPI00366E0724
MSWVVLIEEIRGSGDRQRWGLVPPSFDGRRDTEFATGEEARAEALCLTSAHAPGHPWSERDRQAYRISPDEYLVNVDGATSDFHFRLTVAERIVPG